jgi:DNA ligase-associated metallophosphoesterase
MTRASQFSIATAETHGRKLHLHPHRAAWLEDRSMLICSDVHIGKAAHFRKHGIPVPGMANKANFWRMVDLFEHFNPASVLFLGDLIHSTANPEWDDFVDFLDQYPGLERILVRGNHDVEDDAFFRHHGFEVAEEWTDGTLRFVHQPEEIPVTGMYTFAGHLHPSARMVGRGRQSVTLPCFWFGTHQAVMPAFGEFTGSVKIKPDVNDKVYVVAGSEVVRVK